MLSLYYNEITLLQVSFGEVLNTIAHLLHLLSAFSKGKKINLLMWYQFSHVVSIHFREYLQTWRHFIS